MNDPIKILFIEDLPSDVEIAVRELQKSDLSLTFITVETKEDFLKALGGFMPDIVISDYFLPLFDGMQALKLSLEHDRFLPFIVLTGPKNENTAVTCMKAGATDYIIKGQISRLPFAVKEAIETNKARKEKETALNLLTESEKKYRMLADNMSDVLWILNIVTGRWDYISPSVERLRGYTVAEVMSQSPKQVMTAESYSRVLANIDMETKNFLSGANGNQSFVNEIEQTRKDGSTVWTEVVTRYIKNEKGELTVHGISRDITERKKNNKELVEACEKAEEANLAKSRFLNKISHELRTPMNGIMGFSYLLSTTKLDREQEDFNKMINRSSKQLLEIINDILDFSKLDQKKAKLDKKTFEIRDIINKSVDIISEQAETKNLELFVEIDAKINYGICSDRLKIKQIISNLLSNAVKFTEKGSIKIKVEELEKKQDISIISFSIFDTGIGIAQEKTAEIFEMFNQLDNSDTRRYGGTGLGLSIAKGFVEMMCGTITVKSEIGKGSCFIVTVPFEIDRENHKTQNNKNPAVKTNNNPVKIKVLIVDDDSLTLKLTKHILDRMGWEIMTAIDGLEALKLYTSERFDAIIMDAQMPKMDGFEATQKIREMEKQTGNRTPIIALSAFAMTEDRDKFMDAGMDDYISKPIEKGNVITDMILKYITKE